MDSVEFKEKVEDLGDSIDTLEEALAPLLKQNLTDITSKLPLLDKAKLNVLTTYAIESLLFSTLKLNGVDAKEHPVFTELTRVRQYFAKIEEAERSGGQQQKQNLRLDGSAAGRFIKHALSGNDEYDRERASKQAGEKVNSKIKFDDLSESAGAPEASKPRKRKAADTPADSPSSASTSSSSSSSSSSAGSDSEPAANDGGANNVSLGKPSQKTKRREEVPSPPPQPKSHSNPRKSRNPKYAKTKSNKAPRNSKAVFQDLLNRPQNQGEKG